MEKGEEGLADWIREEQAILWHDLSEALRGAINGAWSIRAANVARRIIEAARLVGATPNGEIPYRLVAGGVYEAVLNAGGVTPDLPSDEAEWERLDELMAKYDSTRATARPVFAATLAAISSPRELAYLREG